MQEAVYELMIRESHMDSFGHVNNAECLRILEEARWELISQRGCGLEEVLASGRGPIVLEANIKFRHELRLREIVTVRTKCRGFRGKILWLEQQVANKSGDVCVGAEITMGLFDLQIRKLIPLDEKWKHALGITENTDGE